ncbi:N-acetylmuramoyl-L-alanine amidase [Nocardioides sp. 1609]|uniref:N-acetylmuramoyl-L-alanine amidase n=1 Tax=Nocardioides sp. 1609 TaxID=2508327 RepID=UPI00106FB194|nr:N-acetylmuramoyl-L-alanine amidase [Nocardioides sp. 1609]
MGTHLTRRHFLLSSGVAAAAVPLAGTAGPALAAAAPRVRVDTHPVFDRAGRAHGVPPALLAALSHAQTRWQDHDGRPSSSLGYGPMHLVDGAAAAEARSRVGKDAGATPAVLDTLGDAVRVSGIGAEAVRSDPAANIRATAALLADHQRRAGRPVGVDTDPAQWFATVAATSGFATAAGQLDVADTVVATLRTGGRVEMAGGSRLFLPASRRTAVPERQRAPLRRRATLARRERDRDGTESPRGLDIEWIPAPYEQYGEGPGDYGNHDLADRPRSPKITHLVVHDTEGEWEGVLDLVTDPTYVSWQYSLRSADGHIAQHALAKDVCWHAGNWYMNMHSIGLEHEGFAAQGAPWYSEAMYRTSAALVRHLARKHDIPLDRAHVIGHDQVPGTTTATIPGMHWDPGPFWDWEHYFDLLRAPLYRGTSRRRAKRGDVVRILPGFVGNQQPVTGATPSGPRDTNFVTLRVAPAPDAALVNDLGLHQTGQPATTEVSDISARATAGTEYVVADVDGDWTAIWFLGTVGWFLNPRRHPTARVVQHPVGRVRPKRGTTAKVYGRAYPEAAAYANPADVQPVSPLGYVLGEGQMYAVGDLDPVTDYYKAKTFSPDTPGDHVNIVGRDRYVQINIGHRIAFVRRAEVDVLR